MWSSADQLLGGASLHHKLHAATALDPTAPDGTQANAKAPVGFAPRRPSELRRPHATLRLRPRDRNGQAGFDSPPNDARPPLPLRTARPAGQGRLPPLCIRSPRCRWLFPKGAGPDQRAPQVSGEGMTPYSRPCGDPKSQINPTQPIAGFLCHPSVRSATRIVRPQPAFGPWLRNTSQSCDAGLPRKGPEAPSQGAAWLSGCQRRD